MNIHNIVLVCSAVLMCDGNPDTDSPMCAQIEAENGGASFVMNNFEPADESQCIATVFTEFAPVDDTTAPE